MTLRHLTEQLREATAQPPPGARERVWRRLRRPAPLPASRYLLAFAATLAVGVLGARLVVGRPAPTVTARDRAVLVALPGTKLAPSAGPATLERGTLLASTWGEPLDVAAAGHALHAEGAVFAVRVLGEALELEVREGVVLLDGARLEAPARWPAGAAGASFSALEAVEPPQARDERQWVLAEDAVAQGALDQAVARFAALGGGDGLKAEAALLRQGQVELWKLHRPAAAARTFDALRARFPAGSLRQEADLSTLEAAVQQADWPRARSLSADFLTRFTRSERRSEVALVGLVSALRLGDVAEACAGLATLDRAGLRSPAELEALEAACRKNER